jgi:hypothetical protein
MLRLLTDFSLRTFVFIRFFFVILQLYEMKLEAIITLISSFHLTEMLKTVYKKFIKYKVLNLENKILQYAS